MFQVAFVCDALLEPSSVDGLLMVPSTIRGLLHENAEKYTGAMKSLATPRHHFTSSAPRP